MYEDTRVIPGTQLANIMCYLKNGFSSVVILKTRLFLNRECESVSVLLDRKGIFIWHLVCLHESSDRAVCICKDLTEMQKGT